jgi:hypothetical protein
MPVAKSISISAKQAKPRTTLRVVKTKRVCLTTMLARRDRAVLRGEYEFLGKIILLRTERGDIEFGENAPTLARLAGDQALVLLNEWQGFPAITSLTAERCPDCHAKCLSCDGTGTRLCMGLNCGGYGKMILGYEPCPAKGCHKQTGVAKHGCKECGGTGRVVGQTAECPACKGEKTVKCPLCEGTGEMATGRKDGAPRDSEAAMCATCNGTARKLQHEEQDWKEFKLGDLDGFTVLGPIHEFVLKADVCRDPKQALELGVVCTDADGNLAALLVKNPQQHGQPQYLHGGTLELRKM